MASNIDALGRYIGNIIAQNKELKSKKQLYAGRVSGNSVKLSDGSKLGKCTVNDMIVSSGDTVIVAKVNGVGVVVGKW